MPSVVTSSRASPSTSKSPRKRNTGGGLPKGPAAFFMTAERAAVSIFASTAHDPPEWAFRIDKRRRTAPRRPVTLRPRAALLEQEVQSASFRSFTVAEAFRDAARGRRSPRSARRRSSEASRIAPLDFSALFFIARCFCERLGTSAAGRPSAMRSRKLPPGANVPRANARRRSSMRAKRWRSTRPSSVERRLRRAIPDGLSAIARQRARTLRHPIRRARRAISIRSRPTFIIRAIPEIEFHDRAQFPAARSPRSSNGNDSRRVRRAHARPRRRRWSRTSNIPSMCRSRNGRS